MRAQRLHMGVATVLLALLAVAPIFWVTYIPASDYPFHLARISILSLGDNPGLLGTFYQFGSWLLPNVAMDALALPLTALVSPEMAVKLFLAAMQLVFLTGCLALHHAVFKRACAWPLLGGLLLYNGMFSFGLFNYLFSSALALWGAALWLASRPGWVRRVVACGVAVVLMWAHMGGFAVYAILIGAFQLYAHLSKVTKGTWPQTLFQLVLDASPFIVALALFMLVSPGSERAADGLNYSPWIGAKPYAALFSLQSGVLWADVLVAVVLGALVVGLAVTRQLTVSRLLLTAAGMLWLAFMVLPPDVLGSYYADVRLVPLAALALLLALSTTDDSRRWTEALVLTVALGLGAVKTAALMQAWATDQGPIDRIVKVIKNLPPNSTLFAATARPYLSMVLSTPGAREAWHPPLGYVSTYASTYGQVFVPLTYADRHKQPMLVMETYRATKELQGDMPFQVPKAADLVALANRLDDHVRDPATPPLNDVYLLVVDTGRYAALPELERFSVFFAGEGFTIFRHGSAAAVDAAQMSAGGQGG